MLSGSKEEEEAKARGDGDTAREEFKKFQTELHEASNDAKNASPYVDRRDGEFVSPSERITPEMPAQIIKRNETFLGYAQNSLRMLRRLEKSPADLQGLIVEFMAQAEKLRAARRLDGRNRRACSTIPGCRLGEAQEQVRVAVKEVRSCPDELGRFAIVRSRYRAARLGRSSLTTPGASTPSPR